MAAGLPMRTLPAPTLESLYPPVPGHLYFAGGDRLPFAPGSGLDSLGNRWWLCEHALLAYAPEADVRQVLSGLGLSVKCLADRHSNGFVYLAQALGYAVLVFRGTEVFRPGDPWDKLRAVLVDWVKDAGVAKVAWQGAGLVHRGFRDAFEALWPGLEVALKQVPVENSVYCCGHSLGGALATLAAYRLQTLGWRKTCLLTAGQPRVGDAGFRSALAGLPIVRLAHTHDLITRLPPGRMGYRHVGEPVRVSGSDPVQPAGTIGSAAAPLSRWLGRLTPRGLVEHAPLYYALRSWNAAVA